MLKKRTLTLGLAGLFMTTSVAFSTLVYAKTKETIFDKPMVQVTVRAGSDCYDTDCAKFRVSIDGKEVGTGQVEYDKRHGQDFTFVSYDFDLWNMVGYHDRFAQVEFLNDRWSPRTSTNIYKDINLRVESIEVKFYGKTNCKVGNFTCLRLYREGNNAFKTILFSVDDAVDYNAGQKIEGSEMPILNLYKKPLWPNAEGGYGKGWMYWNGTVLSIKEHQ